MKIYRDWTLENTNQYDLDLSDGAAVAYNYFRSLGVLRELDESLSNLHPEGMSDGDFDAMLACEEDFLADLLGVKSPQQAIEDGEYDPDADPYALPDWCYEEGDCDRDPCDGCESRACHRCPRGDRPDLI